MSKSPPKVFLNLKINRINNQIQNKLKKLANLIKKQKQLLRQMRRINLQKKNKKNKLNKKKKKYNLAMNLLKRKTQLVSH